MEQPFLQVGDVITIDNVPQLAGCQFRVDEIRVDGAVRLRPAGDTNVDRFNDAAGEFWILPPGVEA